MGMTIMKITNLIFVIMVISLISACKTDEPSKCDVMLEGLVKPETQKYLHDWVTKNLGVGVDISRVATLSPAGNPGSYILELDFDWSVFGATADEVEIKLIGDLRNRLAVAFYIPDRCSVIYSIVDRRVLLRERSLYLHGTSWVSESIGFVQWSRD